ncbi:DUF3472 domain-containing protein [Metabacillus hrfriensis]|uniref:DUF3472 domain-containing protein n=1 Tax=Metabacillus hrfriensis TaxID=3048891 RepID=A0ACD4R9Y0_9BACI|nr:DUF3472 domain-containing protein [Metabacillus sp. CT-WN-B3]WHZ57306.1 DUF3472 domain-containing protein [Metabacillus sp. CT-WN-B3]
MKGTFLAIGLTVSALLASPSLSHAASADNVYLGPLKSVESDIVMSDWSPTITAPYTYWATQNWNQGAEGGGYAGFQQQDERAWANRTVHFALWDPMAVQAPIVSLYSHPDAKVERFGGEGTGLKVMTPYEWDLSKWYRMVVKRWDMQDGTHFGQWVKDVSSDKWTLITEVAYPVKDVNFGGRFTLFQEDWAGTAENARGGRTKNGYNRSLAGTWNSWDKQTMSTNSSNTNWAGGATDEYFWYQSGGTTIPNLANPTTLTISQPAEPELDDIEIDSVKAITKNKKVHINWHLKESSSPQFEYEITIVETENHTQAASVTSIDTRSNSEILTASLDKKKTYNAELKITDIFGQQKTITKQIIQKQ